MPINNQTYLPVMTLRFRFAYFALGILPVSAENEVISSAKSGLDPLPVEQYSAKGVLDGATPRQNPQSSAKSGLDPLPVEQYSAKGVLDGATPKTPSSAKSGLDLLPSEEYSSKGGLDVAIPTSQSNTRWNLGWGMSWRKIGSVGFKTGATNLVAPGVFGANSDPLFPGIGPATGLFDRVYDNGQYVRQEPRTAATGRTSDYSYDAHVPGGPLILSATGGERRVITAASASAPTGWSEGDDWEISPYLSLTRLTDLGKGWSFGPSFNFSFTNVDGSQGGLNTLNASERRDIFDVKVTDRFDTTGLILPSAPYTGSPGALAPLLPAEPSFPRTFEDTLRSQDFADFSDSVQESLEVNLFGISLGADAVYRFENRFFAGLGTGVVLNIADWDAKRGDRLIQVTNGGAPIEIASAAFRNSGTDLLFGFYLQGSLGYQINDSWSIEANARYDWNESLNDSVGGSDFDVDLTGFSLGAGVSYSF
jgi:hypothetical protein